MNIRILKLAGPSILANITVPLVGMVDLAIAGRLGDAASIGGIAISTMLFDLLYWNMGFLRVGTGGYAAQAYGRRDFSDAFRVLVQAVGTAVLSAMVIWAIQLVYLETAFLVVDCTPQVESLAREYFFIRIWAAPATLSLFAFKGWFIGMQNTISPMVVDVTVNVLNLILSVIFGIGLKMGIPGIALGTLLSQYIGLIVAMTLMYIYYKKLFHYINVKASLKLKEMKKFFVLNGNLFLRSTSLLLVYSGFTSIAARYGDNLLAVSTIMMKLMLLYSYFIDGFAYAGEAITGRLVGAKELNMLKKAIRVLFIWTFIIAFISTIAYAFAGEPIFRLMTNNSDVLLAAKTYLPWLLVVPVLSCVAFILDGIFIGATASVAIRDTMLLSAASFFISYFMMESFLGLHALYLAYMVHLVVRTVMMSLQMKSKVLSKATR
ncbi:MAG: MATE family efflux transporter [Bacteroidetes bacterium HGW-Bacteroidetes-8]|jgi:MATE family multidrug resistance protein|nr:MAG: MATE family efflux transporter [Bacteroidetes bacterium HGW-Bacteroidetes-8]